MEDLSWLTALQNYGAEYHNNGQAQDGDPENDIPRTPLMARMFNTLMNELINVVTAAGIPLDGEDDEQVLKAIRALYQAFGLGTMSLPYLDALTRTKLQATKSGFYRWDGNTTDRPDSGLTEGVVLVINNTTNGADTYAIALSNIGAGEAVYIRRVFGSTTGAWIEWWGTDKWITQSSLAATGYQVFPGGLIVQWGTVTKTAIQTPITFPMTFPNAIFTGYASNNGTTGAEADIATLNKTTSGMDVEIDGSGNVTEADWFAIGN